MIKTMVALGRTYDGLKLANLLHKFFNMLTVFSVGSYIPWLWWVDRLSGLQGNAKKITKEFDEFLEDVEEHVKKKRFVGDGNEGQDLVDILLDLQRDSTINFNFTRDTLKAVILNVFAAGTDTTFTALKWTVGELVKHPRVMKRLQEEVTEIAQGRRSMILEEDLEEMKYLKAVIKESLRLHPPVPLLLPRKSTQDVKLKGYDNPKGTQVIINAWVIGRDPDIWNEPNEFRPERFLNSSIEYNGVNFEWLPFGGGRRGCPGIQFAVVVMELALANLVYKFDLTPPIGVKNEELDLSEESRITLRMKSSLMVIPSHRL